MGDSPNPGRGHKAWAIIAVFLVIPIAISVVHIVRLARYYAPYLDEIASLCEELDGDLPLVLAIIRTESRFRPAVVSPRGATGLMQVMPETAQWVARNLLQLEDDTEVNLLDRQMNVSIGISYLKYLQRQFPYSQIAALAAYNAGQTRVRSWIDSGAWDGTAEALEDIPYAETRTYIRRVLSAYEIYKERY